MPDSRQTTASSRPGSRSLMQLALPAALLAITVAVAFLFQRMEELARELARLDQGRLTIARATAEALASRSRAPGPPASRAEGASRRTARPEVRPEEEAASEDEGGAEEEEEERLVEIPEAQSAPSAEPTEA